MDYYYYYYYALKYYDEAESADSNAAADDSAGLTPKTMLQQEDGDGDTLSSAIKMATSVNTLTIPP